jgi:ribosomal protein L37AE/L43A
MRAALHARGVTDDVIALLTPEDAEKFIRTHTPEAALKLFNGGAATDRFEPTTEAAPAYTFLDPESAAALMQRYGRSDAPLPSQDLDEGISDHPTAQELLNANGIYLENYNPGQHSNATCPECSRDSLSVKIDDKGATWYCHHCKWKRPKKGQHAAEPDTEQAVAALPSTVWIELTKIHQDRRPAHQTNLPVSQWHVGEGRLGLRDGTRQGRARQSRQRACVRRADRRHGVVAGDRARRPAR